MVNTVLPRVSTEIACRIKCSFSGPMLAVAEKFPFFAAFFRETSRFFSSFLLPMGENGAILCPAVSGR